MKSLRNTVPALIALLGVGLGLAAANRYSISIASILGYGMAVGVFILMSLEYRLNWRRLIGR